MATEAKAEKAAVAEVKKPDVLLLDPKTVKVGWRARQDDGDISELADSISRIGQLHPIIVRLDKEKAPVIIAGLRRKRACQKLGIKVKAIVVEPGDELNTLTLQLEENIKRKDFDRLEVGEGLKRYKSLYEKKHGLGQGWNLKKGTGKAKTDEERAAEDFVTMASRSLSVSGDTIYRLLGIADLPPEDKKEIAAAKTTRERNVAASKALSKVRKQKKQEKLEAEAAKKEKARAKEKKEAVAKAKKEGKPVPKEEPRIRLFEGDYAKLIKLPDFVKSYKGKIDLVLTDPPYDLERNPILHTARTTINDSSLANWDKLDLGWVLEVAPLMADKATLVAFCPLELVGLYKVACMRAKLTYRGGIVWHKTNPPPAHRAVYAPSVEAIIWATKGEKYTFKPWPNAGTAEAHNFVETPICSGNERLAHPAQKPLALIKRFLDRHTDSASIVFDPFMGTGTTLVAAAKLKLRGVGAETESKFFKMAQTRLAAL